LFKDATTKNQKKKRKQKKRGIPVAGPAKRILLRKEIVQGWSKIQHRTE